jgi:hypothetical protein
MDSGLWLDAFLALPSSAFFVRVPSDYLTDFLGKPQALDMISDFEGAARIVLGTDP